MTNKEKQLVVGDAYVAINIAALPIYTIIAVNELRKKHPHVYAAPWGNHYVLKTIHHEPGTPEFAAAEADLDKKGYMLVIGSSTPIVPRVEVRFWDRDQHDLGCDCGTCSQVNSVSIGYAVFAKGDDEPLEVFYAPSEEAAIYNAEKWCSDNGYAVD